MTYDSEDHWDAALDSKYLRWFHLHGEPALVRIVRIEVGVELTTKGNRKSRRCLVHYEQLRGSIEKVKDLETSDTGYKPLVLNVTNRDAIKDIHGQNRSDCIGKEIVLYQAEDRLGRNMVPCVRIRAKKQ